MTVYPGLRQFLSETASTKRESLAGSKFTVAANLTTVNVSRPFPLDAEIRNRLTLDTPHELLQVFAEAVDIKEGDILTYNGTDYPIRACENWPHPGINSGARFLMLVIEELKS